MIHYIHGTLAIKGDGYIVVETSGIGYMIFVPSNSRFYLLDTGATVKVYIYMAIKEDDVSLFGFEDLSSLEIFKKLITVNGVGAKAGMAIFSALPPEEIKRAIVFEDADMLTRANGIGKKTAQRIVLDLKDKFDNISVGVSSEGISVPAGAAIKTDAKIEAMNALMELGYSRVEANEAVSRVTEEDLTVEEYIKKALINAY